MSGLTQDEIERAAAILHRAAVERSPIDRLPIELQPETVADGYRIQWAGHRLSGERGPWKVGATSLEAQRVLNVEAPFIGRPSRDRIVASGSDVDVESWFLGPSAIEVEVGLLPQIDLDEVPADPLDLAAAVAVVPCIELAGSRFVDLTLVGAPSLVADNAVASAIVQGEPIAMGVDEIRALATASVELTIDGDSIAASTAADALGHPLNVLHFTATTALDWGTPIRRGELVITGTCTGIVWGRTGIRVAGRIAGHEVAVTLV